MVTVATQVQSHDLDQSIEWIFSQHSLGKPIHITSATQAKTIGSGGTSKTFRVLTGGREYFVKFAAFRKMAERTEYHKQLESVNHFPIPHLLAHGSTADNLYDYQVQEWVENHTLLSLIQAGDSSINDHFGACQDALFLLWGETITDAPQESRSGHLKKTLELAKKLREYLGSAIDYPLVINEEEIINGLNIRQMIEDIVGALDSPIPFACKTHGECRTGNVLVTANNGICLIDMRGGYPYWLDDLVFLAWHREFWLAQFLAPPSVRWIDGQKQRLEVNCTVDFPSFVEFAEQGSLKRAKTFAQSHGDIHWERNYYALVAACALREIDSIQRRRTKQALDCCLPQGAEGFWIAEAIKYFKLAQSC